MECRDPVRSVIYKSNLNTATGQRYHSKWSDACASSKALTGLYMLKHQ